uniref:uncharacterized protein LOC100179876 isoform X3 n=1 Tax=Ciona intestinalis TaxID=7719 RepID=UPI00089DA84D|nr:uncharacterized protein LOC100179876 isoform X3 [Ciona intestinalis]|eukprot:XP_018668815.1 uncharacterized protein LOC100179876 isoform X3 [Ciona intestinalis]
MELKSEFDNMEESLRDALRHTEHHTDLGRYVTLQEQPQPLKPSIYVGATEQKRNMELQNFTSTSNNNQMHCQRDMRQAVLDLDDFRRHCILLAERVQKMEEQNYQLIKLAEKQKVEYNKVAAQVVQSELIQRQLQSECFNLKRQVDNLSKYNKILQKQNETSFSGVEKEHGKNNRQVLIEDSNDPMRDLHSSVERKPKNGLTDKIFTKAMGRLQSSPNTEDSDPYKATDVATVVELYSALQKSTVSDVNSEQIKTPNIPNSDNASVGSLNIIHEHPEPYTTNEHADYATPSSKCALQSCSSCPQRHSSSSKPPLSPSRSCSGESLEQRKESCKKTNNRKLFKIKKSTSGSNLENSQSFDNNSYIEVELRRYKEDSTKNDDRLNPASQNKNSHGKRTTQRPSSLVLQSDSSDTLNQTSACSDSQPSASFYENEPFNQNSKNTNNNNGSQHQQKTQAHREISLRLEEKSLSPDSLSSRSSSWNKSSPGLIRRSHSKTPLFTDLPPPPPPPPCEDHVEDEVNRRSKEFSRSESLNKDDSVFSTDTQPRNQTEGSRPLPKLSVWKESADNESGKSPNQDTSGWRRKSYSAACRKSQSLDHIYELEQFDNNKKNMEEKLDVCSMVFSTLQTPKRCSKPQPSFAPQSPDAFVEKSKEQSLEDEFPPPPPPHILQEVMKGFAPIEEDGYVLMDPIENDKNAKFKDLSPKQNSQFELTKKNSKSESSIHQRRSLSKDHSKSSDIGTRPSKNEQESFKPEIGRPKNRRMSEGSAVRRRSDRQSLEDDGGMRKISRHRSISSDHSLRKRENYVPENQNDFTKANPQPRFPSTNPYVKLTSTPKARLSNAEEEKSPMPRSVKESKPLQGRQPTKLTPNVKVTTNSATNGKKKSSSPSSFVNLMKAKFGKSNLGNKSGSKKSEEENVLEKTESSLPVKAASSLIDPRTLSLEPNSYLKPTVDGVLDDKRSKLKLGNNSDAAVGRKLSRPFPNQPLANQQSKGQLLNVVEEVVSDEGFAEGSTIERAEKEQTSEKDVNETNCESRYVDITVQKQEQRNCLNKNPAEIGIKNQPKKNNSYWYDNVVSIGSGSNKQFKVLMTETTFDEDGITRSNCLKQKHTRLRMKEEPPYENYPLVTSSMGQLAPPSYEHVILTRSQKSDNPRPTSVSYNSQNQNREVIATGVTIVRSPQQKAFKPKVESKPTKTTTAFDRIMKSVGHHYSGSKEDLSGKRELDLKNTAQKSHRNTGKNESPQGKLNAEHQKVFEKAFISSVVEAELSQTSHNLMEGGNHKTSSELPCLPLPPSSGGNSTGTGSSFGSLPSDGIVDVTESRTRTSSASCPSLKSQLRLSKTQRNSITSFGYSALQGTVDSSTSTTSSESSSRGRDKNSVGGCLESNSSFGSVERPVTSSGITKSKINPMVQSRLSKSPKNPSFEQETQTKLAPNRRSQSGSRISRLSTPSKLPAPGKSPDSRSTTPKSVFSPSTPNELPPTSANSKQRLKLAPLGLLPPSPSYTNQTSEPVYENAAAFKQHRVNEKQIPALKRVPSSMRPSGSSIGVPSVSARTNSCASNHIDTRRSRKGNPSASGLHRPRPIYPGVGAG